MMGYRILAVLLFMLAWAGIFKGGNSLAISISSLTGIVCWATADILKAIKQGDA